VLENERLGLYPYTMDKNAIIDVLRAHRAELQELGVRHAALFGSVARGEATPDSDIDIAVELDAKAVSDVFTYVGVKDRVAALFEQRVDVINRDFLRPQVRDNAAVDLIYAF
jgi:predicted nucleotidyltransferase